jgi:hypothetical protein
MAWDMPNVTCWLTKDQTHEHSLSSNNIRQDADCALSHDAQVGILSVLHHLTDSTSFLACCFTSQETQSTTNFCKRICPVQTDRFLVKDCHIWLLPFLPDLFKSSRDDGQSSCNGSKSEHDTFDCNSSCMCCSATRRPCVH